MDGPAICSFGPYVCCFVLTEVLDRSKDLYRFLEVVKVELCRYLCKIVNLPDCSIVSIGFSMGSITIAYIRSSFFNCIDKKDKIRIPRRMSSIVLLRYSNRRPINRLEDFS